MAVLINGQELTLSGTVGADWFDDGFTYPEVKSALLALEGDITVRINSGGGIAWEGSAIHSALSDHKGTVSVIVDGIAASAASLIAMAGDTITMSEGAVMMIHDPAVITIGDSSEHQKSIAMLEALSTEYARIYAGRSGKTIDEARELMRAETWLGGEAAIGAGFADEPTAEKAKATPAFDYRIYANAPRRLTAMAKRQNWSMDRQSGHDHRTAAASATTQTEGDTMSDKERADALAAEVETLKAAVAAKDAELATATTAADIAATDAVKADRERRAAIMALEEAAGRTALAERLYLSTMSVDEVKEVLAAAPKASEQAAKPAPTAAEYEAARLAGAELNTPPAANAQPAKAAWGKALARFNKTSPKK